MAWVKTEVGLLDVTVPMQLGLEAFIRKLLVPPLLEISTLEGLSVNVHAAAEA